ncbi:MAG TPA: hypothetical protein VGQ29_06440 [Gemmatimonadales bacterium]|jgi:hypothetical protein|nr:hypothetical protein [Gemmatimonadales bacterium]
MAYEQVLPPDTANEIRDFVIERYVGAASQMAAADAIEREMGKVASNPTLGAAVPGGPFESRRIHRFSVVVANQARTAELAYRVNQKSETVVFSGFREIPTTPL